MIRMRPIALFIKGENKMYKVIDSIVIGLLVICHLNCTNIVKDRRETILRTAMADFSYAGTVRDISAEINNLDPDRELPLPNRFEVQDKFVFFHLAPINVDRLFTDVLVKRLEKLGFVVQEVPLDDAGPILKFGNNDSTGVVFARFSERIFSDPRLKKRWSPYAFIVEMRPKSE